LPEPHEQSTPSSGWMVVQKKIGEVWREPDLALL
jgi:hypothetical protein